MAEVSGRPDLHASGGIGGFDSMAVDGGGYVGQATLFEGGMSVVSRAGSCAWRGRDRGIA